MSLSEREKEREREREREIERDRERENWQIKMSTLLNQSSHKLKLENCRVYAKQQERKKMKDTPTHTDTQTHTHTQTHTDTHTHTDTQTHKHKCNMQILLTCPPMVALMGEDGERK